MKHFLIILLFSTGLMFSSCLKMGLKELPAYSDDAITNFSFEYRWTTIRPSDKDSLFNVYPLNNSFRVSNDTVYNTVSLPEANNNFPQAIHDEVKLDNLIGYCSISTAASISPIGNSPKLGVPADFSKLASYKVIAADGHTSKVWYVVTILK